MTRTGKTVIGVSACLVGQPVRYDGTDRRQEGLESLLAALPGEVALVPICPEVELGLGVPRERIQLVAMAGGVRLIAEESRRDLTGAMEAYAAARLGRSDLDGLAGYVCKSRSPSCGVERVKLFARPGAGEPHRPAGQGRFIAAALEVFPGLPLIEETALADPVARDRFAAAVARYASRPPAP